MSPVVFQRAASFERFADALGVESTAVAAVLPRGGHDEPELWHVFFVTPATAEGDALDVLLGPCPNGLEELSPRRELPGFFDELYRTLDGIATCPPIEPKRRKL